MKKDVSFNAWSTPYNGPSEVNVYQRVDGGSTILIIETDIQGKTKSTARAMLNEWQRDLVIATLSRHAHKGTEEQT